MSTVRSGFLACQALYSWYFLRRFQLVLVLVLVAPLRRVKNLWHQQKEKKEEKISNQMCLLIEEEHNTAKALEGIPKRDLALGLLAFSFFFNSAV
ncbi:Os10g0476200 [Oryza sativa Japonica Group]|jgi:hypothetical protein|uniref:Os10g0476200 protein n=2 Tax=Oryza sativa subsp. japonica TaxID=39947 RepID=Q0IX05_ORYSJ|nr:hypothetical protein EE612_051829 [Oryza sativa]BAF26760.1 Os10g0476200 [Oryza sativa Japonica Group]BAT11293.1 Os10g0476200 [Oryza sativa Japonica Group]|eukprot:NP_001064846.1 Os10g0476200 [Oryza sativa Japonica Group]